MQAFEAWVYPGAAAVFRFILLSADYVSEARLLISSLFSSELVVLLPLLLEPAGSLKKQSAFATPSFIP